MPLEACQACSIMQDADCLPCSKKSPAGKEDASDNLDRGTDYMGIYSSKYMLPGSFENAPASRLVYNIEM